MRDELANASTLDGIEPVSPDPRIGRVLDERYRIEARLGEGGMGIVYEARHEVLGTRLAIKVLRADASRDEEAIARLKREAQAASAIGSEHIVDVRDFGTLDDGSTFIVMERIDGRDLYSLTRGEPLAWKRVRSIALQLCDALGAAHERGIVHRDLKLENVLVTIRRGKPDFVKLLDFGIAKVQGGAKITVAGRVMGTPEYMSPEQCAGQSVDHRTDIYSLGVMMYEMVTGSLPFEDDDLAKLVRMQMQDEPVPPSSVRPDLEIPPALEAVILRCLAKAPDARFASMEEVADALEAIEVATDDAPDSREVPIASPSTSTMEPVLARPTRGAEARAHRAPWIGAAVALVIVAGIAGWVSLDNAPAPASATTHVRAPAPTPPPAAPAPVMEAPPAPPSTPSVVEVPRPAAILVHSEPVARVFAADGALLGDTPLHVERPVDGSVELELRAEGFEPYRITLGSASAEELHVALARRAAPVRRVRVASEPAAHEEAPAVQEPSPPPPEPTSTPASQRPSHQQFLDPWGGG